MANPFIVEVSAKHVHVSREDLDVLFGKGYELTNKKNLSQPGQFACEERVTIVGQKRELKNMSILGPIRSNTQVELSATDCRTAGISAVVRESGDIAGTPGCKIVGPVGEIDIKEGVIVAKRHVHMTSADAAERNVKDKDIISVAIGAPERSAILGDVVVRVNDNFSLAMHLDTDESNAVLGGTSGTIVE